MNNKMREIMETSWKSWHPVLAPTPKMSIMYGAGFEDAVDILMPLLEMSAPAVFSNAEASHMMDGLRGRQKLPCDELVERIKAVID